MTVGAIVLAAGLSSRMGQNKLLADLGGKPVLAHVLAAVDAAGLPSLLVTGADADAVRAVAGGRATVHAADFAVGMSRSLRAGVLAAPAGWDAAIVCLGDMPHVAPAVLRALAGRASRAAIVAPTCGGRRGNPVLWGRDHFSRLASIEGDTGGRALMAELGVTEVETGDDGVLIDIDTPEALAAARRR